jgi:hypothetical protein
MSTINLNVRGVPIELTYEKAYEKFIKDFKGLIEEYGKFSGPEKFFVKNYSKLAQDHSITVEEDLEVIESDLYDLGWDEKTLSKLFGKFELKITDDLMDDCIGAFDCFLYKWTGGDFPLAGYSLNLKDTDDIMVKFSYGWHQTSFGKLFLEQNDALENFHEIATNALYSEIKFVFDRIVVHAADVRQTLNKSQQMDGLREKFYKYITFDSNVINVQIQKYLDAMNLVFYLNSKGSQDDYFSLQQIQTEFKGYVESYGISPQQYKMELSGEILKINLLK